MKIGITGGIGSGKSYVCRLLGERGIVVYDCDSAAKRLMRQSESLRRQLTDLIGPDAYEPNRANEPNEPYSLNKAVVSRFLLPLTTSFIRQCSVILRKAAVSGWRVPYSMSRASTVWWIG